MTTQDTPLEKQESPETESQLISRAQFAVSQCNWVVGECASKWTQKYAKGRTDADFGQLVGLSGDQVYQRRRVWETFGDVRSDYPSLKWSHFYVALNWDDSSECLQWAEENEATIQELKTWRRALHGADAIDDSPPDPWGGDPNVSFVPTTPMPVRDVLEPGADRPEQARDGEGRAPRETSEVAYAPFRSNAGSAPDAEDSPRSSENAKPEQDTEQIVKRLATTLERVNRALTPDVVEAFADLPSGLRERFQTAVEELQAKTHQFVS